MYRYFTLFCLGLIFTSSGAQDELVRYCRYNNLHWSPDGNELAFECYYFEEGQTRPTTPFILVKNLQTQNLVCLNPLPTRFAISRDQRFLLFAGLFGIYLSDLQQNRWAQVIFLDPTTDEYIQEFGFFDNSPGIYWQTTDSWGEALATNALKVTQEQPFNQPWIHQIAYKKLTTAPSSNFNGSVDGLDFSQQESIEFSKQEFRYFFQPRRGQEYDLFDFIRLNRTSGSRETILEKIRPRVLSLNPDSSRLILTIWEPSSGEATWVGWLQSNKWLPIKELAFQSVSWLSPVVFIGLSSTKLVRYDLNQPQATNLMNWAFPQWCEAAFQKSILTHQAEPGEQISVQNETAVKDTNIARIETAPGLFHRSRIVLQQKNRSKKILLVPELSNLEEEW